MDVFSAVKKVFEEKKYFNLFILLTSAIFALLVFISNKNLPIKDGFLYFLLSMITSLTLVFNLYLINKKLNSKVQAALFGQSGVGFISAILASLFASATCVACITSLFGLLGTGGVFFFYDHRVQITYISILLLVISIYFTSQKVLGVCKLCKT